jgi:deoxyribodipyrimidine photo-lyase
MPVQLQRTHTLKDAPYTQGPVMYWMSRDQRLQDNWALQLAQEKADKYGVPLVICFVLTQFLDAPLRHYAFFMEGLAELAERSAALGIPFVLLRGEPGKVFPEFIKEAGIGAVVTDFSPLRVGQAWRKEVSEAIDAPFVEVDAHNIVPVWTASPKAEFGAYTFRPKLQRQLPAFLEEFSPTHTQSKEVVEAWFSTVRSTLRDVEYEWGGSVIDWQHLYSSLPCDRSVAPVTWLKSGESAAHAALFEWIDEHLAGYAEQRNDPSLDAQSDLSPYFHYGQLSAQRVALELTRLRDKEPQLKQDIDAFLEELIVRRELSDNFCFYNSDYDQPSAWPAWAKQTHELHRGDLRQELYTFEQLEKAQTSDPAWNAAQLEMVKDGKMHGYMRMYWAKKILEWTPSPEEALKITIALNDKYSLDGRDPNGYVGAQWSIGGVHDRAWFERPVFGKIRYMNFNGLKRKFKIEEYIQKWTT